MLPETDDQSLSEIDAALHNLQSIDRHVLLFSLFTQPDGDSARE